MTLEILLREIDALPVEQRKQIVIHIVSRLSDDVSEKKHDILEFAGIGVHLRDDKIDAQEYVNRLRDEWDKLS